MCQCRCVVKYILFIVNLLCTLVGLAVIGLGIAVLTQLNTLKEQLQIGSLEFVPLDYLDFIPYCIITLGAIVFLIAFSGCCGSITETKCLLITYAVVMALLAAVKIFITVVLITHLTTYTTKVEDAVDNAFEDPNNNVTFHGLEVLLKCCGTKGPISYDNEYNLVPPTCCENPEDYATTMCPKEIAFQKGCTTMVADWFTSVVETTSVTLIVLIVIELVALAFSIYIIRTIKRKDAVLYH